MCVRVGVDAHVNCKLDKMLVLNFRIKYFFRNHEFFRFLLYTTCVICINPVRSHIVFIATLLFKQ